MLFALSSAMGWSLLDYVRKRLTDHVADLPLAALLNLGLLPWAIGWWLVAGAHLPATSYLMPLMVGATLTTSAQVLFLTALRRTALSVAIPMLALTPVMSSAIAALTLGELPSLLQGVAIVAIVAACLANARQEVDGVSQLDAGAAMMAGVALLWSGSGVVDKWALRHAEPSAHAAAMTGLELLVLLTILAGRGRLRELAVDRAAVPWVAAGFVSLGMGFFLQLLALQTLIVGVVEGVKRGVGTVVSVITGTRLLGEHVAWRRAFALAVIVAGVGALAVT